MRMLSWPGENDRDVNMKAEEGGSGGPDTIDIRGTLVNGCLSLSCRFGFSGSLTGPRN